MNTIDPRLAGQTVRSKGDYFYGWTIVAAAFLITTISCSALFSWGVFILPLSAEFGWSRATLSGVTSVSALAYAASIPFMGLIADRYGFRLTLALGAGLLGLGWLLSSQVQNVWQIYLTAGLCAGIGTGAGFSLPISMVSQWFRRRQGLALGIASCGISLGAAVGPPAISLLIQDYGWRAAYVVSGASILVVCVPVALIAVRRPVRSYVQIYEGEASNQSADVGHGFSLREAVGTWTFWCLFVVFGLSIVSEGVTMVHLVPYAQDVGLSAINAATLITAIGLCGLLGRLTLGHVSDRVGTKPVLVAGLVLQAIVMLWLTVAREPWMLYAYAVMWGIAYSGIMPLLSKMTSQLFGSRSMGAIFGGISVGDGIGFASGPLLAGYLFDTTGTYYVAFLIAGAVTLAAALLLAVLRRPVRAR